MSVINYLDPRKKSHSNVDIILHSTAYTATALSTLCLKNNCSPKSTTHIHVSHKCRQQINHSTMIPWLALIQIETLLHNLLIYVSSLKHNSCERLKSHHLMQTFVVKVLWMDEVLIICWKTFTV